MMLQQPYDGSPLPAKTAPREPDLFLWWQVALDWLPDRSEAYPA